MKAAKTTRGGPLLHKAKHLNPALGILHSDADAHSALNVDLTST